MDVFFTLCQIVLRRTRYFGEIIVSPKDNTPKNEESVVVVLRTGNDKPKLTLMSAYACSGLIPNTETIITNYKIAAGPNQSSMVVLREINCPSEIIYDKNYFLTYTLICYEIVELIEYLSVQYINIYY